MQYNSRNLKAALIDLIRKTETDSNATLVTDVTTMATRHSYDRRDWCILRPTLPLNWICENGHNITEHIGVTNERIKSGKSYLCLQCSNECIRCKNQCIRTLFSKNQKHTDLYKTCKECRDATKIKREENRVSKLVTKAKNPFDELDQNIITTLLNIVPKNRYKNLKLIPLMFYREVCRRFNEAIFDYAETVFNLDDQPKVKLLYLNKMHVPVNNKTLLKMPLRLLSAYLCEPLTTYRNCILYGSRSLTEGDIIYASVKCFGSYAKSIGKTEEDVVKKMTDYYISNGMPPLFGK